MSGEAGVTLAELAEKVGARVAGNGDRRVNGVATLQGAESSDVTFLANPRYRRYLAETRAGAVVVSEEYVDSLTTDGLVHENPYATFARVAALLSPERRPEPGVHPTAVVDPRARLGDGVAVGPHCTVGAGTLVGEGCILGASVTVGEDCRVGANSVLHAGVILAARVTLGARVRVHSGAVIGADGFGFARDGDVWVRVPQLGGVRVGDDVDIGANSAIDRGALDDTVIEDFVKIDNLIQIGHNCRVGARTVIAGYTGIAGSTTIGRDCMIGGGCGIGGHLHIGDGVVMTGGSHVTNDVEGPGMFSSTTTPVQTNQMWRRNAVRFTQLDNMARRLRALERRYNEKEDEGR